LVIVEQNMGCMAVLGSCGVITDCSGSCKTKFGQDASGDCDRDGGQGTCMCGYPCPHDKLHMWDLQYFEIYISSKCIK